MNQITEQFRKHHQERLDLVGQWEQVLTKIQRKDNDINNAQERYLQTKNDIREKQQTIQSKQSFLDQQIEENHEREKKINILERSLAKVRLEQTEENSNMLQYQDEFYILKSQVHKTSSEISSKRSELRQLADSLGTKQDTLADVQNKLQDMKDKLDKMQSDKTSLETKAKELDNILRQEELRNKELDKEIKATRELRMPFHFCI